jgi:hypothetical protein
LWELEDYLSESRKKINGKYDYRYSTLPIVFGQLLREGRIKIDELRGLGDDKVGYIRRVAGFGEKEEGSNPLPCGYVTGVHGALVPGIPGLKSETWGTHRVFPVSLFGRKICVRA